MALLAFDSLRAYSLMPLVTSRPWFRGGCHHLTAGAHTEAVDRSPVLAVMHQLIVRCAQKGVTRLGSKAALVNQRLRMLDSKPDRERLSLNVDPAIEQHLKRVAGAVTDGQNDPIAG